MSLDASIGIHAKRTRDHAAGISAALNEMKTLLPAGARFEEIYATIRMKVGFIQVEMTGVDTCLAAGRMTGQVSQPVKAEDLDLHPMNAPVAATKPERWTHEQIVAARACAGEREEERSRA